MTKHPAPTLFETLPGIIAYLGLRASDLGVHIDMYRITVQKDGGTPVDLVSVEGGPTGRIIDFCLPEAFDEIVISDVIAGINDVLHEIKETLEK